MANKPIDNLIEAESIDATDLFVLKKPAGSRKLQGQVLLNWLTAAADGHGGIKSMDLISTVGLVKTYRITLADNTTFDLPVSDGRGVDSVTKTGTEGLVDTYTIAYSDGTSGTFRITNGAKGDPGADANVWIKFASQKPTESSHTMGDIPDAWIGISAGHDASAPTDWKKYIWYKYKGEKGDTGAAASVQSRSVGYQVSTSGTVIPDGDWSASVPVVPQGRYLWTRTTVQFNSGDPVVSYSVSRFGMDGSGTVVSVCGSDPDSDGNVDLTAGDVGALPITGGTMTGAINMNGQPISGLNDPTENDQAARKKYVDDKAGALLPKSGGTMTGAIAMGGNKVTGLGAPEADTDAATKGYVDGKRAAYTATLSTSWTGSGPYTQTVAISGILASDMPHIMPAYSSDNATAIAQKEAWSCVSKAEAAAGGIKFTCFEDKPTTAVPLQIEVMR